jgi:O-antigen ligase/tetratricopeptide (TPR) repeat protein
LLGIAILGAKFALVPLIFDATLDAPFSVPKAFMSHGLAYLLFAVLLGLLVTHGQAVIPRSWLHIPVLAFLAASAVATLLAVDFGLALYGTHNRMLGLVSILDSVALYFAVAILIRRRAEAIAIGTCILAASALVLGYEGMQVLGRDPLQWSVESVVRPFSTLGHPTVLAQYLTVLAVGSFASALFVGGLRLLVRICLCVFATLLLVGSIGTGTRSVLFGLGAGSAVVVLLIWLIHPNPRARVFSALGALSAVASVALILLVTPIGARLAATLEGPGAEDDPGVLARLEPSAAARVALYQIGIDELRERPVFGYGPDNFIVGVPAYRAERAPEVVRQSLPSSAHSWVFSVATSSGFVGFACFMGIAITALALALRGGFRPMAVVGAATVAAFLGTGATTVNEIGTEWLFWASAGAIATSTTKFGDTSRERAFAPSKPRNPDARATLWLRRLVPGILLAGAAILAVMAASAVDGSRSARASYQARLTGQQALAVELGVRATRSDPGRAEYWDTLGLAYASTTNWREAAAAFDRARTLAPYDTRYWVDLVTADLLLATTGDATAQANAQKFADGAIQMDRNNPRTHLARAVAMQAGGDIREALRSAERALALDPNSTNDQLYVVVAQLRLSSGNASDAAGVARQGISVFGLTNRSVGIRLELARALATSGQPVEAIRELDLALSIQPSNATLQRLRAQIVATIPR